MPRDSLSLSLSPARARVHTTARLFTPSLTPLNPVNPLPNPASSPPKNTDYTRCTCLSRRTPRFTESKMFQCRTMSNDTLIQFYPLLSSVETKQDVVHTSVYLLLLAFYSRKKRSLSLFLSLDIDHPVRTVPYRSSRQGTTWQGGGLKRGCHNTIDLAMFSSLFPRVVRPPGLPRSELLVTPTYVSCDLSSPTCLFFRD